MDRTRLRSLRASSNRSTDNTSKTVHLATTNDEAPSEYSEILSVISFSDTDEELAEIEQKTYPDGILGKEEAYKDIETVFDELENENILDPFTRWKPKEVPPEPKKNTKFVPKRPTALPRRMLTAEYLAKSEKLAKEAARKDSKGKILESAKSTTTTLLPPTQIPPKVFPGRGVSSNVQPPSRKPTNNAIGPARKSLVVELMMEATQEQELLKKKAEALAKEKEQMKMSRIGSAGDAGNVEDERPETASSIITTYEDDPDSGRRTAKLSDADSSRPGSPLDSIERLHSNAWRSNYFEAKQTLGKESLTRTGKRESKDGLKEMHAISPLVTCENEAGCSRKISQIHAGPTKTTSIFCTNESQHQLRPAGVSDSHVSRQEELILELARSKDEKKKPHESAQLDGGSTKPTKTQQGDKTTFKITYKQPRWPHQVTLDKMVDRLYRVKMLILDESQLTSLRDISSTLPSLIVLSVKNCGLKTVDGTLAFPNLQKLHAADNLLTHASQCSLLSELQELDLSGNPIESLNGFGYLGVLHFLRVIKLYDTKVSELKSFHIDLRRLVPSLRDIFPKSKTLSCDFDFDDEEYLNEDYKLLGKTEEELKKEQSTLKKSLHKTTMITNTVKSTTTDTSSNSSNHERSFRSILKISGQMECSDDALNTDIKTFDGTTAPTINAKGDGSVFNSRNVFDQNAEKKSNTGSLNALLNDSTPETVNEDTDLASMEGTNSNRWSLLMPAELSDEFESDEDDEGVGDEIKSNVE